MNCPICKKPIKLNDLISTGWNMIFHAKCEGKLNKMIDKSIEFNFESL